MNSGNRKRWLPRFSVRTLIGIITLVCLFFGSWALTKTVGTRAVAERINDANTDPSDLTSQAPFLVAAYEYQWQLEGYPHTASRRHYLWLVATTIKLPEGFTTFVDRLEDKWYAWTNDGQMRPRRVHGGVI